MELRNVKFLESNTGYWHMTGQIFEDDRGKFKDGVEVYTSRIGSIIIDNMNLLVFTRNSMYVIRDYNKYLGAKELEIVKEIMKRE